MKKTTKKPVKKAAKKKVAAKKTTQSKRPQGMKMNPVVHFEMPSEDRNRMAKFYNKAFGWHTQLLGEEMGNYVLATTSEADKKGTPKHKGMINGGFYPKSNDMPAQYPSVVIAVDDINKAMEKIREAGGEVLGEPMEIPGYGLYVSFFDTEGNRASIMQGFM